MVEKRIDKYSRKINSDLIGKRFDESKELAVKSQKEYFARAEKLEAQVKIIVSGEPTILHHFYIAFAEEFAKHTQDNERWIIYLKWLRRGLDENKLLDISENLFNWSTGGTWVWDIDSYWDVDKWY